MDGRTPVATYLCLTQNQRTTLPAGVAARGSAVNTWPTLGNTCIRTLSERSPCPQKSTNQLLGAGSVQFIAHPSAAVLRGQALRRAPAPRATPTTPEAPAASRATSRSSQRLGSEPTGSHFDAAPRRLAASPPRRSGSRKRAGSRWLTTGPRGPPPPCQWPPGLDWD